MRDEKLMLVFKNRSIPIQNLKFNIQNNKKVDYFL